MFTQIRSENEMSTAATMTMMPGASFGCFFSGEIPAIIAAVPSSFEGERVVGTLNPGAHARRLLNLTSSSGDTLVFPVNLAESIQMLEQHAGKEWLLVKVSLTQTKIKAAIRSDIEDSLDRKLTNSARDQTMFHELCNSGLINIFHHQDQFSIRDIYSRFGESNCQECVLTFHSNKTKDGDHQ